ncbi:DUF6777 domain-containing protein [Streptomyces morookaense]|uniref:DUF6777 domain-containing protein n=1 Tax=Streptomyces morookaense TaxID=1970 RepID=UPI0033E2C7CC
MSSEPPSATRLAGRAPWWRSRTAIVTGALLLAAALAVWFLRQGGGSGEVFLQAASADGKDPFTRSTARSAGGYASVMDDAGAAAVAGGSRSLPGATPGLYAGTRKAAGCDVEQQIDYFAGNQGKGRAFAAAAGIDPDALPAYLRGLTPVHLRADTRVTDHGYKDGSVTSFQSVLQTGTAVLVDDRGTPRVRCACGNPLGPPVAVQGTPRARGDTWDSYDPAKVVVVTPAESVLEAIVVHDPANGEWFERPVGSSGDNDSRATQPKGGLPPGPPARHSASRSH